MLPDEYLNWLQSASPGSVANCTLLSGGRNNRTFKVEFESYSRPEFLVLKCFQVEAKENWTRETEFLALMQQFSVSTVPEMLARNEKHLLMLNSYVEGQPITESSFELVQQVAAFIQSINRPQILKAAEKLARAKGAMFCFSDLLNDIEERLTLLLTTQLQSEVDHQCREFLRTQLVPFAQTHIEILLRRYSAQQEFLPCLSPSDIGFHNCLLGRQLYFMDFEYAGWDGLEKLIADFYAQPRFEPDISKLPQFVNAIVELKNSTELLHRVRAMMPLVHVKWALIFLNEFTVEGVTRRQHSLQTKVNQEYKQVQLLKANQRLAMASQFASALN